MSKVYRSLQNFRDRVSASLTVKKRNILFFLAVFLVVLIAILIRLSPIIHDNRLIKAFDPWIQYYNAEFLSTHSIYDYFHWFDYKSWYPEGIARYTLRPGLTFTIVGVYNIFHFLGFPISLYDLCYFFPAIMGGLTVLAMYFLGKEVLDRRCGLFAAFFLTFSPGHMQRTVAGFFDNETIGVFAVLMTFLFFLKAIRTGRITYSILGGVFSGYLGLSWGGYQYVFYIIPIVVFFLILLNKYNANVLIAYAGVQGTGLFISALFVNFKFDDLFTSIDIGGLILFTGLLIIYHILYTQRNERPKLYNSIMNLIKWGVIPAAIVLAVIIYTVPDIIPFGFGTKFQSILNPLIRNQVAFVASVAEHIPSTWSSIYYNILIPLMILPLGIYFCFKRYIAADIFMIVFLITIFYFTGSMVRIILLFAPAAALLGAYGLVNILKIFGSFYKEQKVEIRRRRKKLLRRRKTIGKGEIYAVYFLVGFLCISQVVHATDLATSQLSYSQLVPGGVLHDWEDSLTWMRTNLPGETVVVSWWDYGYWLTPIGNVTTVNDNSNIRVWKDGMTGIALMQTDEIYSAQMLKELHAEYVLVYFGYFYDGLGGDEGKWQWMVRIPNNHYETYIKKGLVQDNWAENSVFLERDYVNQTDGKYKDKWFQSTLVRLLTWGVPTSDPSDTYPEGSLIQHYISTISNNRDNDGDTWKSEIEKINHQASQIFSVEHFSSNGLVKLFKVDYTPLESKFRIDEPKIFDTGYGTFKLENIGSEELEITNVSVNGVPKNFTMGSSINDNIISEDEEDIVWIDTGSGFEVDDTVNITVTAIGGGTYTFSNSTSNFFVREAEEGAVRINRENSQLIYDQTTDQSEAYIEVENIGDSPVVLDDFYVNSIGNTFSTVEFLSGSSILEPGQSARVKLSDPSISFSDPVEGIRELGIITRNGIKDETIFTANRIIEDEEYGLIISPQSRYSAPELLSQTNLSTRIFINSTESASAYLNNDGTVSITFELKNTGNRGFYLSSIDIFEGNFPDIDTIPESDYNFTHDFDYILPNEQVGIVINISSGYFGLNDEIGVRPIGVYEGTVASDIGFFHLMNKTADLSILDEINGYDTTYINNNSLGQVLIKNVGNGTLNLNLTSQDLISFDNESLGVENISLTYGTSTLGPQDVAILSFAVNQTLTIGTELEIIVKTEEGIFDSYILSVISDET
jgi:dolichyl-diphosphooligosaccharide--protein glycosyltransferase